MEEAGSLVVVLRLWRVFKIIEEFSAGADDEIVDLQDKIEDLEREKEDLAKENERLRLQNGHGGNEDGEMDGHAAQPNGRS